MATLAIIPLREYLESSYRPDREYVDGEVRERAIGESDHSRMQALLIGYLLNRETQWGIIVMPEQRVQVKPTRFRVPDITVVEAPLPVTPILHSPPFLCIEILSRGDRMDDMQERIDDYLTFGVRHIWVLNPRTKRAFLYTSEGMKQAKDGVLRAENPDMEVPMAALG